MILSLRAAFAAALVLLASTVQAMPIRDDTGRTVEIRVPARRIISMAPSVSESLCAIGAQKALVGVTTVDDYPAAVKKLPRIGDFFTPVVERIRALKPDVVILESGTIDKTSVDNLQSRFQVPVFALKSRTYDDVITHLLQLGLIAGSSQGAQKTAAVMRAKAAQAARQIRGKRRVTVFAQVNASPLYAAGPGSFLDDLIRRAGGTNVVRGANPYPQYSKEALLAANPEHYVIAEGSVMAPRTEIAPPLDRLYAVKHGAVHRINADWLLRPTPRLADGLLELTKALHP